VAYTSQPITVGVEGWINNIRADTKATFITPQAGVKADTITTKAEGISFYAHGDIVPNSLRWFARVDFYNPNKNVNNSLYSGYAGISPPNGYNSVGYKLTYSPSTGAPTAVASTTTDPTSKETFLTAGFDFMPYKDIHIEPNVWYTHYSSQLATGSQADYDLVWRVTFFFVFGRKYTQTYTQL
jgi:hypothetical protein